MLLKFAHGRFRTANLYGLLAHIVDIDDRRLLFQVVTWVRRVFMMRLQVVKYDFVIVFPFCALAMRFLHQLLLSQTVV